MGDKQNISAAFQRVLNRAEVSGWVYEVHIDLSQISPVYVDMWKASPAGNDFRMAIDFDEDNQVESFMKELRGYADDFDVDEHVELWIPNRGKGGCPDTIKGLVEDAEAIKEMIGSLYEELDSFINPALSRLQSERCDKIYDAVYEMCKVISGDEGLKWDMSYLGEIAEMAADLMVQRGYKVWFPSIVEDDLGFEYIEDYYEPGNSKAAKK